MRLTKLQQALLGIAAVVIILLLAEFLLFSDKKKRTEKLIKENAELDFKISEANRIKKHAAELEEQMNHLKSQLERLKKILPVDFNKPKFLQDIRRYANEHGLEVVNYSHNKSVVDDVIVEHPFTFKTYGNYHDLGNFFAKLSNYPRIINVKGLHISRAEDTAAYTLKADFIISVFTYREPTEEELRAQIEAKKLERQGGATSNIKRGVVRGK